MVDNSTVQIFGSLFTESISWSREQYAGNHLNMNLTNNTTHCWTVDENAENEWKVTIPCTDVYYKEKMPPPTPPSLGVMSVNYQTEYFVKQEYGIDALLEIYSYFWKQKQQQTKLWNDTYKFYRIDNNWDINFKAKWVSGDDEYHNIWLSPGYNETKMFMIGVTLRQETPQDIHTKWVTQIYEMFNEKFLKVTPIRVHWGKISLSSYCYLQESYPKLEEFKLLRKQWDPYNLFLNKFTRDKLGICDQDE
eukprot:482435_1